MSGKRKYASVSTSALVKKAKKYEKARGMKVASKSRSRKYAQFARGNLRTGGFLGIELKFADSALVGSALTAPTNAAGGEQDPATLLALNAIAQGDGESQRDGKQICVKSCYVVGNVLIPPLANQTAGSTVPTIFIALVLDKQSNGAQLNSEDVFVNPGANATVAASPLRNLEYTSRFQVLDSVLIEPHMLAASYDGTNIETFGLVCPFKLSHNGDIITNFSDTTAVIANIVDTSLHIVAFSTATGPSLSYNSRVRFVG